SLSISPADAVRSVGYYHLAFWAVSRRTRSSEPTAIPPTKPALLIEDPPPAPAWYRSALLPFASDQTAASQDCRWWQRQPRRHALHQQVAVEVQPPAAPRILPYRACRRRMGPPGHGTHRVVHRTLATSRQSHTYRY